MVDVRYVFSEEDKEDGAVAIRAVRPWQLRLRRERSARVWQAIQCWTVILCTQHVYFEEFLYRAPDVEYG